MLWLVSASALISTPRCSPWFVDAMSSADVDNGGHVSRMVGCFVDVCRKGTLSTQPGQLLNAVKVVIIVCLKFPFLDPQKLLDICVPGHFVDMEYFGAQRGNCANNFLGDSAVWLKLISLVSFQLPKVDRHCRYTTSEYPLLDCIFASLKSSGDLDVAHTGCMPNKLCVDDVCKIFLLVNLEGLSAKHVVDQYTTSRLNKNTAILTAYVMSALADARHDVSVYVKTFEHIFSFMSVDEPRLVALMEQHRQQQSVSHQSWLMKHAGMCKSRVSLRRVLQNKGIYGTRDQESLSDVSSRIGVVDVGENRSHPLSVSLNTFSGLVRFPNQMSNVLRMRCYLIACCGHIFDYTKHTGTLVSGTIKTAVDANPVLVPHVASICDAISTLCLNETPFPELFLFRQKCYQLFAVNHWSDVSLVKFLHMYVSAYQNQDVWKLCWKFFCPLMSTQISKDVETFVQRTPFAEESFVRLLRVSVPP